LLAVRDGRRIQYPGWQFDETSSNGVVTGLDIVLAAMDASSFRKAAWLIKPNRTSMISRLSKRCVSVCWIAFTPRLKR
jgi:hypothetical protein